MLLELRHAITFALVTMLIFGGAYHAVFIVIGRTVLGTQAEGSLIRRANGTIVGSRLIAQAFVGAAYVHPRPSAVDYNDASAGGSNLGPSNADHLQVVHKRLEGLTRGELSAADVPSELVTTSGSGLDPHLSARAARVQAARVADARGVPLEQVLALIHRQTEPPTFGVLGTARVNVLELNLALDDAFGRQP